uniref:Uncharacterized protein n=1 Tax=Parascaris equorum TaxID=6256 RepID=A0A914RE54_PAREQ
MFHLSLVAPPSCGLTSVHSLHAYLVFSRVPFQLVFLRCSFVD